jgi:ATP-dependent DNA helicase MPH1
MSSDNDDYGDIPDDEDFVEAISQVSHNQPFSSSDAGTESPVYDDIVDDDLVVGRRSRSILREDGHERDSREQSTEEQKKKSKYKIHIPKIHEHYSKTFVYGTQPDAPLSSPPYRARGPIWKAPKPGLPEAAPVRPPDFSFVMLL